LTIEVRSAIRQKDSLASNLGHTFGHAIEKLSDIKVLNGDAISVGTVLALYFACYEKLITDEKVENIVGEMKRMNLNVYLDKNLDVDALIECMKRDKKSSINELNLVLITDVGLPYFKEDSYFYSVIPY
jgi:3-dehydroquinate synthase